MRASIAASRKLKLRNDEAANRLTSGSNNQNSSKLNGKLRQKPSQPGNGQRTRGSEAKHSSESKTKSRTTSSSSTASPKLNQDKNKAALKKRNVEHSQRLIEQNQPETQEDLNRIASNLYSKAPKPSILSLEQCKLDITNQSSLTTSVKSSLLDDSLLHDDPSHHLKLAMSSADAFKQARGAGKSEKKIDVIKKRYYQKAIFLMVVGSMLFVIGVIFAALYFSGIMKHYQIAGPICLAVGLLTTICGLVWLPIIKTKLKRREQVLTQTFSL